MNMFKALDIWMAELEEEFYDDYMRAYNASQDWANAKRARYEAKQIDVWDIRESLQGNYRGYCCMYVTNKYREEIVEHDGVLSITDVKEKGNIDISTNRNTYEFDYQIIDLNQ